MSVRNPDQYYPHAKLAVDGSSNLLDITNVKISLKNNGKLVKTLRGAGGTSGPIEAAVTFECPVSADGRPLPWDKYVKLGAASQHLLKFKIPGKTDSYTGFFDGLDTDGPHDDAIKDSLSFIGTPA